MIEKLNYISDEELECLISQVEQEELVAAPPDLEERILAAAVKPVSRKNEFHAYCFRVVTSVAAAVALIFLLPQMTEWMGEKISSDFVKTAYGWEIPDYEEVVAPVPSKAEVVAVKTAPSKEDVLKDTGAVERFIRNTGWFSKGNK